MLVKCEVRRQLPCGPHTERRHPKTCYITSGPKTAGTDTGGLQMSGLSGIGNSCPSIRAGGKSKRRDLLSAEAGLLEVLVGLDNLPQAVFGRAIATIGIRVVLLDQRLVLFRDVLT